MIIFLYGPDDYRRSEKKREIVAEFGKKHSALGLGVFDLEIAEGAEQFAQFARNQSIFESAKLAVLENAFGIDAPKLAKLLKPFVAEKGITLLLAEAGKPVKALAFILEKPVLSQKFEKFEGAELVAFAKAFAKKTGLTLDVPAAQFLADVYAGDTWALATEIEKLAAFKASIARKDLDAFDLETAPNYWALLNGLKSYDIKARLAALEALFAINDPAAKIFNILSVQAGQKTPLMAEFDVAIKSGKLDYEEALLDLAIS